MATNEFDSLDFAMQPIFTLAAAAGVGVGPNVLLGVNLSDPAGIGIAGVTVTIGVLIGAATFALAYLTNDNSFGDFDDPYKQIGVLTIGLFLATAFVPQVQQFIAQSDALGLIVLIVESAGYAAVGYLG